MCVVKVPGEHVLSAVELTDGRFAVYLDDVLRGEKIWGARELRACIDHFLASKAELLHPEQPPRRRVVGRHRADDAATPLKRR